MVLRFLDDSCTAQYLQRIGLDGPVSRDLNGLNTLILAQLHHIPFENFDIWNTGICPSLEIDDLFRKIVTKYRGGYCFELNTLFRVLLNSLGFDAYQVIASLVDERGVAAPPAHNCILCRLSGKKYFLDVGFGGQIPLGAVELNDTVQLGYHLVKENDFYYVNRIVDGVETYSLRFRDVEAEPCELIPLNFYISQLPDVHFRHTLRVNQRKADGRVYSLVDHVLKIHTNSGVTEQRLQNAEELQNVLKTCFGMDISGVVLKKSY